MSDRRSAAPPADPRTGEHDRPHGSAAAPRDGDTPPDSRRGLVGPFTGRQLLVAAAVVVAFAVGLKALTTPLGSTVAPVPVAGTSFVPFAPAQLGLQPGDRAPELAGTINGQRVQLTDLDGRPILLSNLLGHPIWINFFASWCPPCQSETPTIEEVYETHRAQGLVVIGVSVQESSAADVKAYARTYGLQYTIGFDGTSAVYRAYHVYGLPTQVFVDRQGLVRQVWNGPLTLPQAEQLLAPLLESGPGPVASNGRGAAASAAS